MIFYYIMPATDCHIVQSAIILDELDQNFTEFFLQLPQNTWDRYPFGKASALKIWQPPYQSWGWNRPGSFSRTMDLACISRRLLYCVLNFAIFSFRSWSSLRYFVTWGIDILKRDMVLQIIFLQTRNPFPRSVLIRSIFSWRPSAVVSFFDPISTKDAILPEKQKMICRIGTFDTVYGKLLCDKVLKGSVPPCSTGNWWPLPLGVTPFPRVSAIAKPLFCAPAPDLGKNELLK